MERDEWRFYFIVLVNKINCASGFHLHSGGRERESMAQWDTQDIHLMNGKLCVHKGQSYRQQIISRP